MQGWHAGPSLKLGRVARDLLDLLLDLLCLLFDELAQDVVFDLDLVEFGRRKSPLFEDCGESWRPPISIKRISERY